MALILNEPKFFGLLMVISGGQCGADQGGIHAAHEMGVETGGVAPLNFRTQWGNDPELGSKYGLTEDASYSYPPRTRSNVERANATLIIATNLSSPGSNLTRKFAHELKRPCLDIQLSRDMLNEDLLSKVPMLVNWIKNNKVAILNVAGNRDNRADLFHYTMTHKLITAVLLSLHQQSLLSVSDV